MVKPYRRTPRGSVFVADALDVYPQIPDGSVDCVISDGPYDMGKGAWDAAVSGGELAAFYAPHVAAWSRVCAPSATVYVFGTGRSWSTVHPIVLSAGWRFDTLITWDKGDTLANTSGVTRLRSWPESSEFVGVYTRDEWNERDEVDAWNARLAEHPARLHFERALSLAGRALVDVDRMLAELRGVDARRTRGLARHYFTASQWGLPSERVFAELCAIVPPLAARTWSDLRDEVDAVADEHRRTCAPRRAYFDGAAVHPVASVWRVPAERAGRLDHPCQKPLELYRRMITASTPPAGAIGELRGRLRGGLVLEPFGGTCRAAVWCERAEPTQIRRYIVIEQNLEHVVDALGSPDDQPAIESP